MKKIYCEEAKKKSFEKISLDKLRELIGWYEPTDKGKTWVVTGIDGIYDVPTQFEAIVISSLEQIIALLLKR